MWYSGIHHMPMARTRSVVLLVLFTVFLSFSCNGVFGNSGLHNNNKLAKKTIQTKYGDTYDCMNYTNDLPVFPPSQLKGSRDPQKSSSLFNPSNFWLNGKGCPDGLVPIRRTTKDDLKRAKLATEIHASKYNPLTIDKHGTHYAIVGTTDANTKYHGGSAIISVYHPSVVGTQYSSGRIKTANSACFNTLCNSIKPVRSDMPLDMVLEPVSTIDHKYDWKFMLFWDVANGNWRLKVSKDETDIGFWPKNIFTSLGDGANYVEWGGEVFSPPNVPSPPMGSGSSMLEMTNYDAYCRLIKIINETDYEVNAVGTKAFSDVNQYQVKDEGDTHEADFQHLVLFGGPGGYTGL
ncbi:hypothetical protein CFP56_043961 [Quercus suber]|uniref:Neprosin PEP catalytic domain-containing protein n=1 Tax=Quercus suber TaxID=58331 RepID=A0AAW0IQQ3_QUESU